MQGKIIKGIAGFYYVYAEDGNTYECRAKGIFRKDKFKPLVGDNVDITVLDEKELEGSVTEIHKRKNSLIRPAVANVDQALVIFAMDNPKPNFMLLDRFLIMMEREGVPAVICFNKKDLLEEQAIEEFAGVYKKCGYSVLYTSAEKEEGIRELHELLDGRTTAVAGPSGVGKSSLVNRLQPNVQMETGSISRKIERGKHTTRHSEIIPIAADTYIMDTPGFSTLYIPGFEKEDLQNFYPEFKEYEPYCRFKGCSHITGGGFYENIPRMLPEGARAVVKKDSYEVPAIFRLLAKEGNIAEEMMYNTYNMGIGMMLALDPKDAEKAIEALKAVGEEAYVVGSVEEGEKGVTLC